MIDNKNLEVWFITGSQHLYGEETLKKVASHSQEIATFLNASKDIAVSIIFKPIVTTPEEILAVCKEVNAFNQLHWYHYMDAYFFAGENVDQWLEDLAKTNVAFAYTIQPRYTMERY